MQPDFTQCMVSNSRMAARAITRRYDACVRPFGITATQLSVMGMIISARGRNVSELAEVRGFERTTLTRNIDRLERMGLIVSQPAAHGNGRICNLTGAGEALVEKVLPVWEQAQAEIREELGRAAFDQTIATLKRLATV